MTEIPMPQRVAVLSDGSPLALKVLYCLQRLGTEVHLLELKSPGAARHSRYCDRYLRMPLPDIQSETLEAFGDRLRDYCTQHRIDGLVGADILGAGVVHALAPRLPGVTAFPSSSLEVLGMLDDKWTFQHFMETHGIPCPKALRLEGPGDLERLQNAGMTFPLVVKPLYGESSHGIIQAKRLEDIETHLEKGGRHAQFPLVVQEYAPGFDADLSLLARDGEVVCHLLQSRRNPCSLEFFADERLLEIGRRIVRASHYTGVANIDLRVDESTGAIRVLECNPRFWYTLQASLWAGINFVEAGFALAAGGSFVRASPAAGAYHLHSHLLKHLLWQPRQWRGIAPYNLRGLWQAMRDPLPFLL